MKPSCCWYAWAWFVDNGVDNEILGNENSNKTAISFFSYWWHFKHAVQPYSGKYRYTEHENNNDRSHNTLSVVSLIKNKLI